MSVPTDADNLTETDEALAERVQRGCVKSYETLDRRYRVRLIHLLRRRVGHEADAEDLAQSALWTAYEKIGSYDPSRRFSTWLFTIAIRKSIDHGRAAKRRPADARSAGDAAERSADAGPGPVQRALAAEAADSVWRTAERVLKPTAWSALWLHYGEDQTPAEVAQALGMSRANARVVLHRARRAVAAAMRDPQSHGDRRPETPHSITPDLGAVSR